MSKSVRIVMFVLLAVSCGALFMAPVAPGEPPAQSVDRPNYLPMAEAPRLDLFTTDMTAMFDSRSYERATHLPRVLHPDRIAPAVCFGEGTSDEQMRSVLEQWGWLDVRFNIGGRWPGTTGDPFALTWSLVPDGLLIPGGGVPGELASSSVLFSQLDALFAGQGGRATWIARIQSCFDRWQALTGLSYTRVTAAGVDWDSGDPWGTSGNGTTVGDVRISMHLIDGNSNVLAYNQFPGGGSGGDMVLDSAENWGSATNNNVFFRDVLMHEHGHGIGLAHVCPVIGTVNGRLMEPIINTNIDGPRHDDMRGGHFNYGDDKENNDTSGTATALGALSNGVPVTLGAIPAPAVPNSSTLSLDAGSDLDYYSFSVGFSSTINITVTPVGFSYDSSQQACGGNPNSCCNGNTIDTLSIADLNFQVLASDGSTLIINGSGAAAGLPESVTNAPLGGSPGNFFLKILTPGVFPGSQMYTLSITANLSGADLSPPNPSPMTFSVNPGPGSSTSVYMQATEAVDGGSPPVQYFFDFTSGTGVPAGHDSGWVASRDYTDVGLQPNSVYRYTVKARDSAPVPNQTIVSAEQIGTTGIQTPTGVSTSSIGNTSVMLTATGTFTNVGFIDTAFFFEMTPAGGTNANTWVGTTSTTVTGLNPCTLYTVRVKARNLLAIETPFSPSTNVTTTGTCSCALLGDVNLDGVVNGMDITPFLRVKTGFPLGGDHPPCADFMTGTLDGDTAAFVTVLTGP
ncbi:MAG: matrixin family metalloprotease [Planctomycetota bacterium]